MVQPTSQLFEFSKMKHDFTSSPLSPHHFQLPTFNSFANPTKHPTDLSLSKDYSDYGVAFSSPKTYLSGRFQNHLKTLKNHQKQHLKTSYLLIKILSYLTPPKKATIHIRASTPTASRASPPAPPATARSRAPQPAASAAAPPRHRSRRPRAAGRPQKSGHRTSETGHRKTGVSHEGRLEGWI